MRSAVTARPAQSGIAAMTCSIVGGIATSASEPSAAATLCAWSSARAVIIGGGVGGTSIAYHLAELGWTDIVLVDRAELTSGSTFHSAGLVGQLRGSVTLTRMMMYGAELYRRLAAETGDGSVVARGRLAPARVVSPERFEELRRQAGWAKTFGLPLELIAPDEAQALVPADVDRRRPRRGLPADRRLARSVGPGAGARRRRPGPRA